MMEMVLGEIDYMIAKSLKSDIYIHHQYEISWESNHFGQSNHQCEINVLVMMRIQAN